VTEEVAGALDEVELAGTLEGETDAGLDEDETAGVLDETGAAGPLEEAGAGDALEEAKADGVAIEVELTEIDEAEPDCNAALRTAPQTAELVLIGPAPFFR
jgi:hypothetical protein